MDIPNEYKRNLYVAVLVLLVVLSFLFAMQFFSELRAYGLIGSKDLGTITLSGHGEVQAIPDIANVYFSISKDAKTVEEAQDAVAKIEKASLDFLRTSGVEDKDIKTSNASFHPKYEYRKAVCPEIPLGFGTEGVTSAPSYYCPEGKQVIIGYTASESITIKIRQTDDVGKIMQGLGSLGISNLNGPNFAIDNEDSLKAEARREAIQDAKEKAEILAKDLGVSLGKVANFNESGNYPGPMMYKADMMGVSASAERIPAEIPKGENTISVDVTITYEIR